MTKLLTKSKVGAPTVITSEVEKKLESILKIGGTIAEATSYAGIGERTYYDRQKANMAFSQRMEKAKHYADIVAKNVVVESITKDRDLNTAKWWLEKRQFRDSGVAIQVNVKPILGGKCVSTNISDKENIKIEEKN